MPSALDIIRDEHRTVRRVLHLLEDIADDVATLARAVKSGKVASITRFLRAFSRAVHHPKEEKILYPALAARDLSIALSLDGYLKDHAIDYALLREIETALAGAGKTPGLARLREAIRAYVGHKLRHIEREDEFFLPLAGRVLDAASLEAMKAAFAAQAGPAVIADMRAELDSLVGAGRPNNDQIRRAAV